MKTDCDLLIVGAGPSGTVAAMYAARRGLKAIVVDRDTFPRDKVCGDALSGKTMSVLDELGLLEAVAGLDGAEINHVILSSPEHVDCRVDMRSKQHFDPLTGRHVPMRGYVIRRQVFDHFLVQETRSRGIEVREGFAVKDLLRDDAGCVVGVRGQPVGAASGNGHGQAEEEIRARVVLGCDGFSSIVARRTGLYTHDPRHWLVALRCYYENVAGTTDELELHFVDEVRPGYFWIFPLENGGANIGIGMIHSAMKRKQVDLRRALAEVTSRAPFAERFAEARPAEKPVGWNLPLGSRRRPCHGDGFLLLGDAASLIDPFSGEGIGNAFYSARIAAEVCQEAIAEGDTSARTLRRYEDRLWEALGPELKVSYQMQQIGRVRPLLNFVIGKGARSEEVSDHICGMLANAVPKKELTSPLYYLKLLFA
jgi:geranylgeranyl reductase family protein